MDLGNNGRENAETFKLLAALFLEEPVIDMVEHFQTVFDLDLGDSMEDIHDDYERLFFGQETHLLPYESSYTRISDAPVPPGDVTTIVYNSYIREGLLLDEPDIVPDHISAELAFIGYLLEVGRNDALQEFLRSHAIQWVPQFCDDLYESAGTDFYRELAAVTKDCVLSMYEGFPDE